MSGIRIVTDTASDITAQQAQQMNVRLVPLSIAFGERKMPMESEEDFQSFFEQLYEERELPTTGQPSPEAYLNEYREAEKNQEDVLVLTLSGGLSGTIRSAQVAKELSGYDRVTILDTRQAILTQRMLVERAVLRRSQGRSVEEIAEELLEARDRLVVCGVLDTLTFLRKGGRIPAGFDVIGNVLSLKPIIELKDGALIKLGVARGQRKGREYLLKEFEAAPVDPEWPVYTGYTYDRKLGEDFYREACERLSLLAARMYPVGGVIGTHVGKNCAALAFARKAPLGGQV